MQDEIKLNLGCGSTKLDGYINIDIEPSVNPDLVHDFRNSLPYKDSSVSQVVIFHVVEHIEKKYHERLFEEIHRVLIPKRQVYISYPEFLAVVDNYRSNYKGMRDFWEKTIYGRQLYPSDYHVSLMDTSQFTLFLRQIGFTEIRSTPEKEEPWNTVVRAIKGEPPPNYEDLLRKEIFE